MDGMLVGEDDEVRQVREIVGSRQLPSLFSAFEVKVQGTFDGDPITYVYLHQVHDDKPTDEQLSEVQAFKSSIKTDAKAAFNGRPVFFRFLPPPSI